MVAQLQPPTRPLPRGAATWSWSRGISARWQWVRIYHQGPHSKNGHTPRIWGPKARFDPHRRDRAGKPQVDPDGRSVLYVGADLATSLCEVFGEGRDAAICPMWRAAILEPVTPLVLLDLCKAGSAMAIGALPALADCNEKRDLTQQWARAIYEDQPARRPVTGIRYRSAYNGGVSIALWDSAGRVRTVMTRSRVADHALDSPVLLPRIQRELAARGISLEFVTTDQCDVCNPP